MNVSPRTPQPQQVDSLKSFLSISSRLPKQPPNYRVRAMLRIIGSLHHDISMLFQHRANWPLGLRADDECFQVDGVFELMISSTLAMLLSAIDSLKLHIWCNESISDIEHDSFIDTRRRRKFLGDLGTYWFRSNNIPHIRD